MTASPRATRAATPPAPAAQCAHAVLHCNLNTGDVDRSTAFHLAAFDLQERMRSANPDDAELQRNLLLGSRRSYVQLCVTYVIPP